MQNVSDHKRINKQLKSTIFHKASYAKNYSSSPAEGPSGDGLRNDAILNMYMNVGQDWRKRVAEFCMQTNHI